MDFNTFIVIGRLTKDLVGGSTAAGKMYARSSLATYGGKDQPSIFLDFTLFGRNAEWAIENLKKGDRVLMEGSLENRTFKPKDGGEERTILQFGFVNTVRKEQGTAGEAPKKSPRASAVIDEQDEEPFESKRAKEVQKSLEEFF